MGKMDDHVEKQRKAMESMKSVITLLKEAASNKQRINMPKTEDDMHKGFDQEHCPFGSCDGSGYTKLKSSGEVKTVRCQCYHEFVLKRKLVNSKIQPNFWDVEMEDLHQLMGKIKISHLKPKEKQEEIKIDKRKKKQDPETPEEYVVRSYDVKEIRKGVHYFAENYTAKVLSFLEEKPRKKTLDLMLMGDPGKGKTYMACAIAKEFMRKGKTVYFTRMRTLLDESFDQKNSIRHMIRTTDLLIIDELGQEYHTDSQWALKQIQDIFKERQETGLPIICTTNAYPNELESYYEGSLMSTFNGRFLMMMMHGEFDLRTLEARSRFEQLDFLND